jgi:hypothetical protein
MVIDMNDSRIGTLEQLRRFLDGTLDVQFAPASDAASRYGHIARVVRRVGYAHLARADKQVVLRYLGATSGYGPAQVKRLVARAMAGEPLVRRYRAPPQASAATPRPTCDCWPRWTPPLAPCRGRPRCMCCGEPSIGTMTAASSAWRDCRYRTSITCVPAAPTSGSG